MDIPLIALLTPTSGGGERPLLEWRAAAGAERYDVVVLNADGTTYWAWSTPDISVFVGGIEMPNSLTPGPRIKAGMAWYVMAFDGAGTPTAQSEVRPLSP